MIRALLLAAAVSGALAPPQAAQPRRVYVSALDANGAPVDDLTPEDVQIKEGGKTCDIAHVGPALGKMQIAIVVDDNGTGIFRVAIARFIEALFGRAEFAISAVTGQTMKLTDYTTDRSELIAAINKLGARPGSADGGQLLEGITESAQELRRREAGRPIIVALTVGGEEHTPLQPAHAFNLLRQSGAALHVVAVIGSQLRGTAATTKPSELLGENLSLGEVLGDGPKRSGGHREEVSAVAGVDTGLNQLAETLKHQYMIEYMLPAGAKRSDRLSVTTKRKGITLRAPTHIPDK